MWWLTGGLRSSSSVKENIRKAALEAASEKALKRALSQTLTAVGETASVVSVASSSIASMATVISAIKSGPPTVEAPEPSPTPSLVPVDGVGKISEVLEGVVPPEPEPTPVPVAEAAVDHDEL